MNQQERSYPDPDINLESAPYWEAANEGRLLIKRCDDCEQPHFYPRSLCPHCFSANTAWVEASGKGEIYTFSIMRRAQIPYAIAYVRLQEEVTMMTNIVECDFATLAIAQAVELVFRKTQSGQALPVFRPVVR